MSENADKMLLWRGICHAVSGANQKLVVYEASGVSAL